MKHSVLKVHPQDNVIVALSDLSENQEIVYEGLRYILQEAIPAKHKFTTADLAAGDQVIMYGVLVGKTQVALKAGSLISTSNIKHASTDFKVSEQQPAGGLLM